MDARKLILFITHSQEFLGLVFGGVVFEGLSPTSKVVFLSFGLPALKGAGFLPSVSSCSGGAAHVALIAMCEFVPVNRVSDFQPLAVHCHHVSFSIECHMCHVTSRPCMPCVRQV